MDASILKQFKCLEISELVSEFLWFTVCLGFGPCVVVQVFKGIRWMSWHQEPMKDVGACDMPRGVGNQTLIRGFPNGETWHP